ncbi:MAG TPA: tRNA lysidine(34) synthetase TilS, partial [Anaerolineae bacterium]|nr:tRNA lysidine(34) synthetase TilS [Anaerolineae bacterium]
MRVWRYVSRITHHELMSGKSWEALLRRRVVETVRPYPLTPPSAKIIVGVSGGPDSLALLHLLRQLCGTDWLVVAHVQHGLRPSAPAEADFVRETAAAWNIPFVETQVDAAELARQAGMTVEEAGRHARYRFFAQTARQFGAEAVAVGHNADDQAETVLMNLLRGSGLAGLGGMRPVGRAPGAADLVLLRPLLHTSRADIEAYCAACQLQPRHDESNRDVSYFRNRIRHQLMPLLAAFNPQIKPHLGQLAQVVQADYDLLQQLFQEKQPDLLAGQGEGWLALRRSAWRKLPVSWQRLALRQAVLAIRP